MKCDFSGYATKANIRCADGRTIRKDAFKDNDGKRVPLVWQHMHNNPENILGHAILENRNDGVYAYCTFNGTKAGKTAKTLVENGDIYSLSIHAGQLTQKGGDVLHGNINEVSLVISPANSGALIDNITIAHADGTYTDVDDEAIISFNCPVTISHDEDDPDSLSHAEGDQTVGDIIKTMTEEQKNALYYLVGQALGDSVQHSSEEGDDDMPHFNAFEGQSDGSEPKATTTLTHAQIGEIFADAAKCGSLKAAIIAHADDYGIKDIETLFPDAKDVNTPPAWIKRNTEWVAGVLNGAKHSPFSRIRTRQADITADEARAKGYTKGNKKIEEVFTLLQRTTTPTTIYKKQKFDRDDLIDITDFAVVPWVKGEMRLMLNEEIARAILISDGRSVLAADGKKNPDKIDENCIRPIWKEEELYAIHKTIASTGMTELEDILRSMEDYEGAGSPVMYTYQSKVTDWLLLKDTTGRRIFETEASLASFLGVERFVKVPLMKNQTRKVGETGSEKTMQLMGIIVDLRDYTIGADKGGQIGTFDDFDIDYNQYKYLMETRMSGALTAVHSAIVLEKDVTPAASG